MVNCLAQATNKSKETDPNQIYGKMSLSFDFIQKQQEMMNQCLAVNSERELIESYSCEKNFSFICQKSKKNIWFEKIKNIKKLIFLNSFRKG